MAPAQTVEPPNLELRVTRLEDDVKTVLCNQTKIIGILQHVATQEDLACLATKDDLKNGLAGLEQRIMAKLDNMG